MVGDAPPWAAKETLTRLSEMGGVHLVTRSDLDLLLAPEWVSAVRCMLRAGGWGVESLALPVVEALYRGLQAGAKAVFR